MTSLRFPEITDELLSAYIDKAVTEEEKRLVETAIAAEPAIAWRLETLRQTVTLLRTMPAVALPRSFVLSEAQLTPVAEQRERKVHTPLVSTESPWVGLWVVWRSFWAVGSPLLRNAAAASFATLLILLMGNFFVTQPQRITAPVIPTNQATHVAVAPAPSQAGPSVSDPASETNTDTEAGASVAMTPEGATGNGVPESLTTTSDDSAAMDARPTATPQALPTSPSMTMMRAPGPDDGVVLVPEAEGIGGAGGAIFSEGYDEQGRMAEEMIVVTASSATDQATEDSAGRTIESSVGQTLTESTSATPPSEPEEGMSVATVNTLTQTETYTTESITATSPLSIASPITISEAQVATTTATSGTVAPQASVVLSASTQIQSETPQTARGGASSTAAVGPVNTLSRLEISQISLAFLTLVLTMLWWRSRTTDSRSV